MQTKQPLSTISYNTPAFLESVLNRLIHEHVLDYYMFINHIGELDPFGEQEKDHIHLFVVPNKRINTADLDDLLIEPVPNNKPLRCISWNTSKVDDWILYVLHDSDYLKTKFEQRQIQYNYTDIKSSNEDDLRRKFRHAYQSSGYARSRNLYHYSVSGGTLKELLSIGAIPVNQVTAYQEFFKETRKHISIKELKDQDG